MEKPSTDQRLLQAVRLLRDRHFYTSIREICHSLVHGLHRLSGSKSLVEMTEPYYLREVLFAYGVEWQDPSPPHRELCDCGAKHTWAPDHHSDWCSAIEWHHTRQVEQTVKLYIQEAHERICC